MRKFKILAFKELHPNTTIQACNCGEGKGLNMEILWFLSVSTLANFFGEYTACFFTDLKSRGDSTSCYQTTWFFKEKRCPPQICGNKKRLAPNVKSMMVPEPKIQAISKLERRQSIKIFWAGKHFLWVDCRWKWRIIQKTTDVTDHNGRLKVGFWVNQEEDLGGKLKYF